MGREMVLVTDWGKISRGWIGPKFLMLLALLLHTHTHTHIVHASCQSKFIGAAKQIITAIGCKAHLALDLATRLYG